MSREDNLGWTSVRFTGHKHPDLWKTDWPFMKPVHPLLLEGSLSPVLIYISPTPRSLRSCGCAVRGAVVSSLMPELVVYCR